jgi:CubicO group peptidase (beta-lactamase class C family)
MAAAPLPRSTPSAQGADALGIAALVDALDAAPGVEPHSLMVLRHGRVIAEGWWAPYRPEHRRQLYSLSKSFTATAVGFAVAEGLLGLDDPVVAHFPELDAEITDPRSRAILVRHLLAMASGHETDQWEPAVARDPGDPVRGFLLGPPEREPGSVFTYNQPCTYTLAAIVQRLTGRTLTEYLRPRLFDPLGAEDVAWLQHPPGRDLGFIGLHATTETVARLGELYLRRGSWAGKRLLPEEWVAEATRAHIPTKGFGNQGQDWQLGYGRHFWMARHGYRGDGAYGQFCLVLPEQDAVVALTSATRDLQSALDPVWEHLLPALDGGAAGEAADEALRRRLAGLLVPPVTGRAEPEGGAAAWEGAAFTPADGGEPDTQPTLTGARLARRAGHWELTLLEDEGPLVLPVAPGGWAAADGFPATASGGWTDAETLRLDVLFPETPHRLTVTCSLPGRALRTRWATPPFASLPLRALRSPA